MLIIGCGYVGRRLAHHFVDLGEAVAGVVRSPETAEELHRDGIQPIRADLDHPELPILVSVGERVFYLAPPPETGDRDPRVRRALAWFDVSGQPRRIVYISTTGVYGDCAGAWVDERKEINPQVPRAKRRADAEQSFRDWADRQGREIVILRVAGIYGPGRLPLERIRRGLPLVREDEAPFTNRIHVDDLVQVCIAAMERGISGRVYHACDGHPSTMNDYFNRVADLAGLPRPPTVSLAEAPGQLSAGMLSYMQESRRLSNRRILDELGVRLAYPSLSEGLPSCFDAERGR